MAQVTLPYNLVPGTPENVNNLMSNLTALRDGVNTIDTAQIANGAVTAAKLASGVAGTPDDGSVTSAKLATALADNLAITNGSNTRRASVTATTERTTTSSTYADVTGASVTVTIPTDGYVLVGIAVEIKTSGNGFGLLRVVAGSTNIASVPPGTAQNLAGGMIAVNNTTYEKTSAAAMTHSALTGTGSQTIKAQFLNYGGPTYSTSVKNCYMTVLTGTY